MYRKTVLTNGLRIVTHDMKDRDSVAIGLWIGVGGRYEDDQNKGAAHFLEHIAFKGSRKYSCDEIKIQIEGVGGNLNAFTSEEQTCYYAKIPAKCLNKTFDILADMVLYPLILKSDVQKESTVILEEIKMYHDIPQYFVLELLDDLMWPNHPLGKNLAGTPESVSHMTHADLKKFHQRHYFAGNTVVAACGQLNHQEFVELVRKKMGELSSKKPELFLSADNSQGRPKGKFFRKEVEQMHVALAMLGLNDDHKDKYALGLLNVILGGNMSSRLFDEVREKRGLAYSISSSTKSLNDTGVFLIRAGVDNNKLVGAMEVILKELEKIKRKDVLQGEFTRAKDYFLGQLLLGLEDTLDHMLWLGEATISLDKVRTLKDIIKEVNRITIPDIRRVANAILKDDHYSLAIVGPLTDKQEKELRTMLRVN